MGFGDDEEILQDFLVEAGEILDQLSEQLVDLERRPNDTDLLNAIFRGFHTVKGGAGFLQLTAMVDCCHVTENLFDILRNGQREVTSELMDVVLQALDTVNSQFAAVSRSEDPPVAAPELIAQLERLVSCEDLAEGGVQEEEPATGSDSSAQRAASCASETGKSAVGEDDITDDEFEKLLDAISDDSSSDASVVGKIAMGETAPAVKDAVSGSATGVNNGAAVAADGSDEITESEFEDLLDQLHGSGKGPGTGETPTEHKPPASESVSASGNIITESEFEELLDQLHGDGKGPGAGKSTEAKAKPANKSADDLITEGEFEDLLNQLHGKDKSLGGVGEKAPSQPPVVNQAASKKKKSTPPLRADKSAVSSQTKETGTPQTSISVGETTVRVDTQRLDDIMNMVGELVLVRNRLVRLGDGSDDEALGKAVSNLDVVTADLQTSVMKTRMQPIKKVFGRFPRVVRDLARSLKKEIILELQGEETDLDKNLVEALADPLVHLVRNAVDHGIEIPAEREAKGKPRGGKIILAAQQEGDHILLSISDDGSGMDADRLRSIAVEKGLLDEDAAQRLPDSEAFALIFAPGFSTKKEISDVSGRGVGMDVVKTKISQLNGSIDIDSKLGTGSKIVIKVPLTLAIMPTLMIMLGEQTFALPLVSVNEIFHMDLTRSNVVDGQECVTIREKAVPVFHLKRWLVNGTCIEEEQREAHVVIVSVGTQRVGFVVDQLVGQEEVVIKPLGKMLQGTPGMAGATITGDGTIALILDVPSMLKRYAGNT